jgi:hypothetical protein
VPVQFPGSFDAAAEQHLNMLVLTGGQERTKEEYARLFVSAGLRLTSMLPVAYPYGVFEGAPNR